MEWFPYISETTRFLSLVFLDLARLDPQLQNRGLVQFLACFLQNVLSFTYICGLHIYFLLAKVAGRTAYDPPG